MCLHAQNGKGGEGGGGGGEGREGDGRGGEERYNFFFLNPSPEKYMGNIPVTPVQQLFQMEPQATITRYYINFSLSDA